MKVSVIMPLHDKGAYIRETLGSLKKQTHLDWEAIVVENNSTDSGPAIVEELSRGDKRVILVDASKEAQGPGAARNIGIERASGGWCLFLDADDLVLEDHLESLLVRATETGTEVSASNWLEFMDSSELDIWSTEVQAQMLRKEALGLAGKVNSIEDATIAFAPWAVHCALIRRDSLTEERRWIPRLDKFASEDTAFWFRVLYGKKVAYTGKYTALYRIETRNYRNRADDLPFWLDAVEQFVATNLEFLEGIGSVPNRRQRESLTRLWENLYFRALRQEDRTLAARALMQANKWLSSTPFKDLSFPLKARRLAGLPLFGRLMAFYGKAG